MSEQSEIDKAISVGLWYGLTESQKREVLGRDGSDVSGLTNDELDKVFLKDIYIPLWSDSIPWLKNTGITGFYCSILSTLSKHGYLTLSNQYYLFDIFIKWRY